MSSGLYSGASGLTLGYALYSSLPSLWGGDVGYSDNFPTPALALDFISYNTLDPRITFSRGSQATLTDSTGKLTYAPNNLLLYSEQFDNAAWGKFNATVSANQSVAPDGTTTADNILPNGTASTGQGVYRQSISVANATAYIYTIYAKANGYGGLQMTCHGATAPTWSATFNLTTGAIVGKGSSVTLQSITPAGNGWYRCAVVVTANSTSADIRIYVGPTANMQANGSVTAYTADGTSGVFIWGAQLEAVTYQTTPSTYNSTTPKNLLGYTQEFDNAAWTKSNAFVQTNLLLQSQAFDVAATWASSDVTVSANNSTAPDGTSTADTITEGTAGTAFISQGVTTTGGATYTASIFVRRGNTDWLRLVSSDGTNGYNLWVNTATGALGGNSVTGSGIYTASTITAVGGGWYRVTLTGSNPLTTNGIRVNSATANLSNTRVSGATYSLWGAQLVQGATAGGYQPTYAAAAAVQYTAPDGTLSADKLVEDTVNTTHRTLNNIAVTVSASGPSANTIYVKAGERTAVRLTDNDIQGADFDLITGAVSNLGTGVTATATGVGNGWWRLSVIRTNSTGSGRIVLYIMSGGNTSYTGDGTSGIYIWGAQLSNSASLTPYVYNPGAAPTSTAYYGPRFDYDPVTLQAKGLLIEEQRTNLCLQSAACTVAPWTGDTSGGSIPTASANYATSPDGTNTATRLQINRGAGTFSRWYQPIAAASATYTASIWMRTTSGTGTANVGLRVDTTGVNCVVTGTWQRFSVTTAAASTAPNIQILSFTSIAGTDVSADILIWGAQLEAGAFATSYIPTVASTVTRSADVATMTGANFSNWYNQNEGTFTVEADSANLSTAYASTVLTVWQTASNRYGFHVRPATGGFSWYTYVGAVEQARINGGAVSANQVTRMAGVYKTNDTNAAFDGVVGTTDTSCSITNMTVLYLGVEASVNYLNGHIRRISYYPQRLPNATLQGITA